MDNLAVKLNITRKQVMVELLFLIICYLTFSTFLESSSVIVNNTSYYY